ncbi:hypothetical protein MAE02_49440 [Microvirga aerophila]|uniref:Uncharacterized protein n=1 Tax=Microvirga aerophila TaxID=670291 RepID=A0A512BZ75_9HYPH|nr:hypothetical protein MAE02_49440 [Microvirga aerophila]
MALRREGRETLEAAAHVSRLMKEVNPGLGGCRCHIGSKRSNSLRD